MEPEPKIQRSQIDCSNISELIKNNNFDQIKENIKEFFDEPSNIPHLYHPLINCIISKKYNIFNYLYINHYGPTGKRNMSCLFFEIIRRNDFEGFQFCVKRFSLNATVLSSDNIVLKTIVQYDRVNFIQYLVQSIPNGIKIDISFFNHICTYDSVLVLDYILSIYKENNGGISYTTIMNTLFELCISNNKKKVVDYLLNLYNFNINYAFNVDVFDKILEYAFKNGTFEMITYLIECVTIHPKYSSQIMLVSNGILFHHMCNRFQSDPNIKNMIEYMINLYKKLYVPIKIHEGTIDIFINNGNMDIVKYFINLCIFDNNYDPINTYHAIITACRNNNLELVTYIGNLHTIYKKKYKEINLAYSDKFILKYTAIDTCCENGNLDILKYLFGIDETACKTNKIPWKHNSMYTETFLRNAIKNNHIHIIEYIFDKYNELAHDFNKFTTGSSSNRMTTLFGVAARYSNIDMIKFLLNLYKKYPGAPLINIKKNQEEALHNAIGSRDIEKVKYLINLYKIDSNYGKFSLEYVENLLCFEENDDIEIEKYLFELYKHDSNYKPIDINYKNAIIFYNYCVKKNYEMIKYLLNLHIIDKNYETVNISINRYNSIIYIIMNNYELFNYILDLGKIYPAYRINLSISKSNIIFDACCTLNIDIVDKIINLYKTVPYLKPININQVYQNKTLFVHVFRLQNIQLIEYFMNLYKNNPDYQKLIINDITEMLLKSTFNMIVNAKYYDFHFYDTSYKTLRFIVKNKDYNVKFDTNTAILTLLRASRSINNVNIYNVYGVSTHDTFNNFKLLVTLYRHNKNFTPLDENISFILTNLSAKIKWTRKEQSFFANIGKLANFNMI